MANLALIHHYVSIYDFAEGDKYYQNLVDSIQQRSQAKSTAEMMMEAKPRMK